MIDSKDNQQAMDMEQKMISDKFSFQQERKIIRPQILKQLKVYM